MERSAPLHIVNATLGQLGQLPLDVIRFVLLPMLLLDERDSSPATAALLRRQQSVSAAAAAAAAAVSASSGEHVLERGEPLSPSALLPWWVVALVPDVIAADIAHSGDLPQGSAVSTVVVRLRCELPYRTRFGVAMLGFVGCRTRVLWAAFFFLFFCFFLFCFVFCSSCGTLVQPPGFPTSRC